MRRVLAVLAIAGLASVGCTAEPETTADEEASSDGSAYTVSELPREVNRRVAKCFASSWSARGAEVRTDARYTSGGVVPILGGAVNGAFHAVGHLLMIGSEGERVLRTLEGDLREISESQHLNDAQKALVTACVSSELISYAQNGMSKYLGPAAAVENYEGVCTEYAGIYSRLVQSLGVRGGVLTGRVGTGGHAWNWVELDGKRLWIEPQLNTLRARANFIDPEREAPQVSSSSSCAEPGGRVASEAQCCTGAARTIEGSLVCVAPPCEAKGDAICTTASTTCAAIGGVTTSTSCGASVDGSSCCAFGR